MSGKKNQIFLNYLNKFEKNQKVKKKRKFDDLKDIDDDYRRKLKNINQDQNQDFERPKQNEKAEKQKNQKIDGSFRGNKTKKSGLGFEGETNTRIKFVAE